MGRLTDEGINRTIARMQELGDRVRHREKIRDEIEEEIERLQRRVDLCNDDIGLCYEEAGRKALIHEDLYEEHNDVFGFYPEDPLPDAECTECGERYWSAEGHKDKPICDACCEGLANEYNEMQFYLQGRKS